MTAQPICTFPLAYESRPGYNDHAYPVLMDRKGSYATYWTVWSPVHNPHTITWPGLTELGAARLAAEINNMGEFSYGL
jgi:hypothetical protein